MRGLVSRGEFIMPTKTEGKVVTHDHSLIKHFLETKWYLLTKEDGL